MLLVLLIFSSTATLLSVTFCSLNHKPTYWAKKTKVVVSDFKDAMGFNSSVYKCTKVCSAAKGYFIVDSSTNSSHEPPLAAW